MKYLLLALQYLPHVLNGVLAVETAIAGAAGKTKREVVLSAVLAGATVAEQVPEDHVQLICRLIDGLVGTLNSSGVFKHGTA